MKYGLMSPLVANINTNLLSIGDVARISSKTKWFNVPDILPVDPTYNTPPAVITINDGGTSYIDDYSLPRLDAESLGDSGIGVPSNFPPRGYYLPPEEATAPRRLCGVPGKKYPRDKVWHRYKDNWLRRANIFAKNYQATRTSQEGKDIAINGNFGSDESKVI